MDKETLRMQMLSGVITESEYKAKLQENFFKNLIDKVRKKEKPIEPEKAKSELDDLTDEQALALYNEYIKQSKGIDPHDPHIGEYALMYQTLSRELETMYPNVIKKSLNEHYVAGGIVGIGAINQIPPRTKAVYEDAFEHFLGQKYGLNEVEDSQAVAAAEKVEDKVETDPEVEAIINKLSAEEKKEILGNLAKMGITANSSIETVANKIEDKIGSVLNEIKWEDAKQKIPKITKVLGQALVAQNAVPLLSVAIGHALNPSSPFLTGVGLTFGVGGALIGLAKVLSDGLEEGKELSLYEDESPTKEEIAAFEAAVDKLVYMTGMSKEDAIAAIGRVAQIKENKDDMPEAPSHEETDAAQVYEANPLEGGPGYMTKYRVGVLSALIADAEKDLIKYEEEGLLSPELTEKIKGTIEKLKSSREALKAQYREETGKDV